MFNLSEDSVFLLREAAKRLPPQDGRRISIPTLYRWASRGVGGVRLATVRIGGRLYTSDTALASFVAAQNAAEESGLRQSSPLAAAARRSQRAREDAEAERLGL